MTNPNYCYRAYGLIIHSDFELPELVVTKSDTADVTIKRGKIERDFPMDTYGGRGHFTQDEQHMDWAAIGKFNIHGVSEILVDINPGVSENLLRFPLLGSVMALLLQLRGLLVLHASAVLVNGVGVGFMGDKMAGKSTTAGALVSHGHRLITDDVLAINLDSEPTIVPGFPQMKLTDESASIVNLADTQILPPVDYPGLVKRQHNVASHFFDDVAVPKRFYILQRAKEAAIESLTAPEQFQALMRFSYLYRFGKEGMAMNRGAEVMKQCATLAGKDMVRRLIVPDSVDKVFEVVSFIEADVRG